MTAINERRWFCAAICLGLFGQKLPKRRADADRISDRRIAGQSHGLAAAAAETDRLAVTTAAQFRHPAIAAIGIEGSVFVPDCFKRLVADIFEAKEWSRRRGRAEPCRMT